MPEGEPTPDANTTNAPMVAPPAQEDRAASVRLGVGVYALRPFSVGEPCAAAWRTAGDAVRATPSNKGSNRVIAAPHGHAARQVHRSGR